MLNCSLLPYKDMLAQVMICMYKLVIRRLVEKPAVPAGMGIKWRRPIALPAWK